MVKKNAEKHNTLCIVYMMQQRNNTDFYSINERLSLECIYFTWG